MEERAVPVDGQTGELTGGKIQGKRARGAGGNLEDDGRSCTEGILAGRSDRLVGACDAR